MTIPGVGAKGAIALVAKVGEDPARFPKAAAWPPGSAWCPASMPSADASRCSASASAGCLSAPALDPGGAPCVALGRAQRGSHQPLGDGIEGASVHQHCLFRPDHLYVLRSGPRRADPGLSQAGRGVPAPLLHLRTTRGLRVAITEYRSPRVAKSDHHCDGMKGTPCIPENLCCPLAGLAETDSVMWTGMPADSIKARAPATGPHHEAGSMAAISRSAKNRVCLLHRGSDHLSVRGCPSECGSAYGFDPDTPSKGRFRGQDHNIYGVHRT